MSRVTHFEISAKDPENVVDFYKTVFGWQIVKWEGPVEYWLVTTGESDSPGIDGGIFRQNELFTGTVNTVEVSDIDEYIAKVEENGGQVVVEKNIVPGFGYQAYCQDVEGTIFGLHQSDPSAWK